jgi:ribonuclease P protein component
LRVQQAGRRHRGKFLTFLQAAAAESEGRIGITVSKKVGNSPARALTKRRLRELYRLHRDIWPTGVDVVVVANPGAAQARWSELLQEWLSWISRQSKRR